MAIEIIYDRMCVIMSLVKWRPFSKLILNSSITVPTGKERPPDIEIKVVL